MAAHLSSQLHRSTQLPARSKPKVKQSTNVLRCAKSHPLFAIIYDPQIHLEQLENILIRERFFWSQCARSRRLLVQKVNLSSASGTATKSNSPNRLRKGVETSTGTPNGDTSGGPCSRISKLSSSRKNASYERLKEYIATGSYLINI